MQFPTEIPVLTAEYKLLTLLCENIYRKAENPPASSTQNNHITSAPTCVQRRRRAQGDAPRSGSGGWRGCWRHDARFPPGGSGGFAPPSVSSSSSSSSSLPRLGTKTGNFGIAGQGRWAEKGQPTSWEPPPRCLLPVTGVSPLLLLLFSALCSLHRGSNRRRVTAC